MTQLLDTAQLLHLRMEALGLRGEGAQPGANADPAARIALVARRMLAVQGQDWRSARWALGVRAPGTTMADVHDAFNSGAVVRSWPMRGTIHLLPAEDIGWMQALTARRVLAGAPKRREFLGMSDQVLDRLVETSIAALAQGSPLDRDQLADTWTEAGLEWKSNWRYHLIWWLCQNGHAVFGPVGGGDGMTAEPLLVPVSSWIANARELTGDEALAELATRYAAARGAVTAKDLAWWAGIPAGEAKRAFALATEAGRLIEVRLDSGPSGAAGAMWADPTELDRALSGSTTSAEQEWLLLPSFDEHLLGYQDRAAQLAPEHFERIVPGRNGMFLATVTRGGRVVGTWKRGTRKGTGLVGTPLPGEQLAPGMAQLQDRAAAWADFHAASETPFTEAED